MNKKGITMISLVFYILSFFAVISVVGTISVHITKNMDVMSLETNPNYAQNQLDRYLRKFFNREDNYEILKDNETNSDYIIFTKFGSGNETNTVKYYPKSTSSNKGFLLLETHSNTNLIKKLVIAENIIEMGIYEAETGLGKYVEVELKVLKGNETVKFVLSYGVER